MLGGLTLRVFDSEEQKCMEAVLVLLVWLMVSLHLMQGGRSRAIVHASFIGTFTFLSKANSFFLSVRIYPDERTEAWLIVILSVNLELIRKVEEDVFWLSQHVDDPSVFADGFPFLLHPSLDFDRARLQDQFSALVVEEGTELVRAGWFGGVVGL